MKKLGITLIIIVLFNAINLCAMQWKNTKHPNFKLVPSLQAQALLYIARSEDPAIKAIVDTIEAQGNLQNLYHKAIGKTNSVTKNGNSTESIAKSSQDSIVFTEAINENRGSNQPFVLFDEDLFLIRKGLETLKKGYLGDPVIVPIIHFNKQTLIQVFGALRCAFGHYDMISRFVTATAYYNEIESLKYLQSLGANINIDSGDSVAGSLLEKASYFCSLSIIDYLLNPQSGYMLKRKDMAAAIECCGSCNRDTEKDKQVALEKLKKAQTALLERLAALDAGFLNAVANGVDIKILKELLEQDADINAVDEQGNTALMLAAEADDLQTVAFLLKKRANIGLMNKAGLTAQQLANQAGNTGIVEVLEIARLSVLRAAHEVGWWIFY